MCSRAVTTAAETLNIVAVRRSIISRDFHTRTNWMLELEYMLTTCRSTVFATVKVAVLVPGACVPPRPALDVVGAQPFSRPHR